jgi:type II secretory pathway component GspD/PulD (secretin)
MKTPIASLCLFFTLAVSHATAQNIQINAKVLSIPTDSPALKEAGLTVDAAEGQSNLGVVSFDRATAMLAKLEKAPGVQILSHPTFTTRSGQQATIEGIREFIYATEFKASQLTNATEAKPTQLASSQIVAATPATPSAFEMQPIGFRMEIDPVITPEGAISVAMLPELTSFEGFVNYGSPIKAVAADKDGKLQEVTLTENQITQPLFSRSKLKTILTLQSGQCVILGGAGGNEGGNITQAPDLLAKPKSLTFFIIQMTVVK